MWVTPAKWVEGIVEMVTQVEAKLQGMPIEALNLVEVELGGSENNDQGIEHLKMVRMLQGCP